jgi:hypothetical protein
MSSRNEALARTFGGRSVRRSLSVALIVGTVLNAINQGPEMLAGHWPVWWKLMLTYFVPFAVASYGSYGVPELRVKTKKGAPNGAPLGRPPACERPDVCVA